MQHNQAQKRSQGHESRNITTSKSGFDKRNMKCFYCQKKGHFKSECKKRQAKQKASQSKEVKSENHHVLISEQENVYNSEEDWLDDSAASKHIIHHLDWFITYHKNDGREPAVQIGDNSMKWKWKDMAKLKY